MAKKDQKKPKLGRKLRKQFRKAVKRYGDEIVLGLLVGVASNFVSESARTRVRRRKTTSTRQQAQAV